MSKFVRSEFVPPLTEIVEEQGVIRLAEGAWEEFTALTNGNLRATPLARREAAEFLARFEEKQKVPEA